MSPAFRVYNASLQTDVVEPQSDEIEKILEEFGWSHDNVIMALCDDGAYGDIVFHKPDHLVVFQQADFRNQQSQGLSVYNKLTKEWTLLREISPEDNEVREEEEESDDDYDISSVPIQEHHFYSS